ncbi:MULTISPECIES: dienelactone hydrolase family protein [unclassified Streptomyces]|uniref:dienelactone hydrolase family protein n=1 Tax=unclassified Streptomyces TaxID=2593676 RepID=UPI002E189828|nr:MULTISPECIES: dienelactone hydrolase family protein [unclassified Streptomyces]
MTVKTLEIPTADSVADGFAAFPEGGGKHPGVLMYPDGFGIRPVLREMAAELAGHGYYVLVPNVFYRNGPAPVAELPGFVGARDRERVMGAVMPLIHAHTLERVLRDAEDYLGFLGAQTEVAAGPLGVTGYCIGGLYAARTAAAHPGRVGALAAFHAPVGVDGPGLFETVTAQVHLGHAEGDLTPDALVELNRGLDAAGVAYTSEIHPGTVHGFTMADTESFSAAGLKLHWERLLPLLERTLNGA